LEESGYVGHQLQVFMVRVLFILFAEDTGVFNRHQVTRYLMKFTDESGIDTEMHLGKLFQTLDKPVEERNHNLIDELNAFPYVNGHLFKERIDLPSFTPEMREQLLQCCLFNWKDISPAIFGSLFQSIMDKEARRNLGAHYTSETNILRLIEPLFLTELKDEFNKANTLKQNNLRNKRLIALMQKVRSLSFLDPACGCGNFLIITYRELRRIELQIMQAQEKQEQGHVPLEIDPQISLNNFYGIEIEEWPARIAEVAMWLTQHQMNLEFAKSFGREPDLLPLREHANIHHANALTTDWADVVSPTQLDYIIGNPPFVGHSWRNSKQKSEMGAVFPKTGKFGKLDFVATWFYKAAMFAQNTTDIAFVATNSITLGEQTGILWRPILDMGYNLHFAHRTFQWHNDAKGKAAVHCVIIGFGRQARVEKWLFDYPDIKGNPVPLKVNNINPYLIDAPNVVLPSRSKPPTGMPAMTQGNKPVDGGHLILAPDERKILIQKYPHLEQWIKPYIGGRELINGLERYCLWLADTSVKTLRELSQIPEIKERFDGVKAARLKSPTASVREQASTPYLFTQNRQPKGNFLAVPEVSSERRKYIPIGFMSAGYVPSNQVYMIPDVGLYEFGIMTSQMQMDWMRTVAGRLKNDYRYSPNVYQLFPWPTVNETQRKRVEDLAQKVLNARQSEVEKDPDTTLADLYDPDLMPLALRKAHKTLDKAVDALYQKESFKTPLERVKHLFELYEQCTQME